MSLENATSINRAHLEAKLLSHVTLETQNSEQSGTYPSSPPVMLFNIKLVLKIIQN